jgi:hypothetical protein
MLVLSCIGRRVIPASFQKVLQKKEFGIPCCIRNAKNNAVLEHLILLILSRAVKVFLVTISIKECMLCLLTVQEAMEMLLMQ